MLARKLYEIGAFLDKSRSPKGEGFRLVLHDKNPNAPLSPFYLNLRTSDNPKPGPLNKETLSMIGKELLTLALRFVQRADYLAGVPRAGDPIVEAMREKIMEETKLTGLLGIHNRISSRRIRLVKQERDGKRAGVTIHEEDVGLAKNGGLVILVDDLITKADSKLASIHCLEDAGFKVGDVMVVLDRQQGGGEELARAGYKLWPVFTINDLLFFYFREGVVTAKVYDEICRYLHG